LPVSQTRSRLQREWWCRYCCRARTQRVVDHPLYTTHLLAMPLSSLIHHPKRTLGPPYLHHTTPIKPYTTLPAAVIAPTNSNLQSSYAASYAASTATCARTAEARAAAARRRRKS
jgi:hypothetical protein